MPRRNSSGGMPHTTKQKGKPRRGSGQGTYSRLKKARKADRYDRPYLDGTYDRALMGE